MIAINYTDRLIAFIDILGFGDLVYRSETNQVALDLISNILDRIRDVDDFFGSPESFFAHSNYDQVDDDYRTLLNEVFEKAKAENLINRVQVTTFSDSIVFSSPATSDGLNAFRYFLIKLFVYTSRFPLLLRGGISCGALIHNDKSIFGPAMNNAYYTESKTAKHPRIAIDGKALAFLNSIKDDPITQIFTKELLTDEEDKIQYVDQISLCTSKVAENMCKSVPFETLEQLKTTTEKLRTEFAQNEPIMEKLNWYTAYFNRRINEIGEISISKLHPIGLPIEYETRSVLPLIITE